MTDRILPLPYLPTYIARRPGTSKVDFNESFNPIFASNWQKASDNYAANHRNFYPSPYINIELDSTQTASKQYDTYKPSYRPQYDLKSMDLYNGVRPLTMPNHTTQTSQQWSRFLDEYPDRFQINYPLPDEENDLYYPNRPGRYPYQTIRESQNCYSGLTSQIHPVTNPFRQSQSKQKSLVAHPIWLPYGTAPRRYQKPPSKKN